MEIKGSEIIRIYVFNRKLVPENIDICHDKYYELNVNDNLLQIFDGNNEIYRVRFVNENKNGNKSIILDYITEICKPFKI